MVFTSHNFKEHTMKTLLFNPLSFFLKASTVLGGSIATVGIIETNVSRFGLRGSVHDSAGGRFLPLSGEDPGPSYVYITDTLCFKLNTDNQAKLSWSIGASSEIFYQSEPNCNGEQDNLPVDSETFNDAGQRISICYSIRVPKNHYIGLWFKDDSPAAGTNEGTSIGVKGHFNYYKLTSTQNYVRRFAT